MSGTTRTFGRRTETGSGQPAPAGPLLRTTQAQSGSMLADPGAEAAKARAAMRDRLFHEVIDVVPLKDLYGMEPEQARAELGDVSRTLLSRGNSYNLDMGDGETLIQEIINDILGLGPLEVLIQRDDIADIMVCGPDKIFIEVKGRLELTSIRFRSEEQLRNVASRIVQAIGRRVDESSPICDARLKDGSRVAIVIPPIAIDGTCITIRKFRKEKLQLSDLVKYNSISPAGAKLLEIISACRLNVLVSGGTGSGKSLSVDSRVLTPSGWKRMGDVQEGDILRAPTGNNTRVIGVYPQGVLPAFHLVVEDGRHVKCSLDHLWTILESNVPVTTSDIISRLSQGLQTSIEPIYPAAATKSDAIPVPFISDVAQPKASWVPDIFGLARSLLEGRDEDASWVLNLDSALRFVFIQELLGDRRVQGKVKVNRSASQAISNIVWSLGGSCSSADDDVGNACQLSISVERKPLRVIAVNSDGHAQMQCIAVDDEQHLYVTDGYVPTHNTTLLNVLTRFIDPEESIITCEDAAELQLQQPNVRRWETRPANLEGKGEIPMSVLVKASLRHRPERIIIGEVRGPEAFDLLQAMNTGHDGSAGTVHSNSPREAVSRVESLIAMGGFNLPARQVREQIVSSLDVIVQASRLRDGSRKITHITEVVGMEGETPLLQDLMKMEIQEGLDGKLETRHVMTGIRPTFWEKARYYGMDKELLEVIEGSRKK